MKHTTVGVKSHMISFRISSTEYRLLKALQPLQGARSFSDFARDTLLRQLAMVLDELAHDVHVDDLDTRVSLLQRDLERLRSQMPKPKSAA